LIATLCVVLAATVLGASLIALATRRAAAQAEADLALTATVDDAMPNPGQDIVFTIVLINNGPSTGTGITISDVLPPDLSLESWTPSLGSYDPASGLWSVGTLAAGHTEMLTIHAKVTSTAPQTDTTFISHSDEVDPVTSNNSASVTETPASPKSGPPTGAAPPLAPSPVAPTAVVASPRFTG
jgi:uncharacterized repeat protein (TIGR01451 family)